VTDQINPANLIPQEAIPKEQEPDFVSKSDISGWRGGVDLNLKKVIRGETLDKKLSTHVREVLDQELLNSRERYTKIAKWMRQYLGKRKRKVWPHLFSANVAVPLSRSDSDAIAVRVFDSIFGKQKIFLCKALTEAMMSFAVGLEKALDWLFKDIMKLKEKATPAILESVILGTGILKMVYESKKRTVYRYADPNEQQDETIPKYDAQGTDAKIIKEVISDYEGPNVYYVPRKDFIISSDATTIQNAYLVGFRNYYRKPQIELKGKQGIYYPDKVKIVVGEKGVESTSGDNFDSVQKDIAEMVGKRLEKTARTKPYEIWELYLKYDVDDDGEEDEIVVTFHKETGTILKAIYNPVFTGFRPFIALKGYPVAGQFDGQGVCEILESCQEEADAFHNQRLDRMTMINAPPILIRSGGGIDDFALIPNKTWIVDGNLSDAVQVVDLGREYPSTFQEENLLVSYGDRAVGITPNVMGQSSAERPVAKETYALIQEANKKFLWMVNNHRMGFLDLFWMVIDFISQYQPEYTYYIPDPMTGQLQEQKINFPSSQMLRDGIQVSFQVSDELINQEARREMNIVKYQLLGDFMTKTAGILQQISNPQVPSDIKIALLQANEIGVKLMKQIISDFDTPDSESIVWDFSKSMNIQKAIMQSADLQQQQMGPPPQGAPAPGGGGAPAMPEQAGMGEMGPGVPMVGGPEQGPPAIPIGQK